MSHGKIREEKNCLNCGHHVEEHFCPHCGQENTEPRQPFHYLFTHFIEDFTHYDGQFWKTLKYLMIRPGQLTKEYIVGKRQIYVAPVKLYIFISFITFLLPAFLPSGENHKEKETKATNVEQKQADQEKAKQTLEQLQKEGILSVENTEKAKKVIDKQEADSTLSEDGLFDSTFDKENNKVLGASNLKEYDSLHKTSGSTLYTISRPFAKKTFELKEEGLNKEEIKERFIETFVHTLPKALFIYLPIFAFFLWIFHNKKKWWYFDHGIFTLHYFSFLLLCILIFMVKDSLISLLPQYGIIRVVNTLASVFLFFYLCVYFFIAHHKVYETRKRTSILKGILLFMINSFGLFVMLLVLLYISFLMIH
jgi:hypothetical protein